MDDRTSRAPEANAPAGNGVSPARAYLDTPSSLPERYGEDRLVILPRDPYWFFAYWELTPARWDAVHNEYSRESFDGAVLVLRVYDVSEASESDGATFFDIVIDPAAERWYVKVERPGRTYMARLGLRLSNGRFIVLLVSNKIRLPRGAISEKTDSQWMAVGYDADAAERWERLMEGGIEQIGRGSAEAARAMAQRWEFLKAMYSGSVSSWGSSSSSSALSPAPASEEQRHG